MTPGSGCVGNGPKRQSGGGAGNLGRRRKKLVVGVMSWSRLVSRVLVMLKAAPRGSRGGYRRVRCRRSHSRRVRSRGRSPEREVHRERAEVRHPPGALRPHDQRHDVPRHDDVAERDGLVVVPADQGGPGRLFRANRTLPHRNAPLKGGPPGFQCQGLSLPPPDVAVQALRKEQCRRRPRAALPVGTRRPEARALRTQPRRHIQTRLNHSRQVPSAAMGSRNAGLRRAPCAERRNAGTTERRNDEQSMFRRGNHRLR